MSGSSFGKVFRVTTYGESHNKSLGCIIDGCPPGIEINESDIQAELDRRKPGQSRYTTQRKESDKVHIHSGVFEGKTLGTPIMLQINNEDQKSKDYSKFKDCFRPGHADFTYQHKYGHRDHRGGGRSSARETVARVASGAIAKKYLSSLGIEFFAYVQQIGEFKAENINLDERDNNPFNFPDKNKIADIENYINFLRKNGNSCGARINLEIRSVPIGLGEPCFDKIDALLAYAIMGIPAVKAVEIGDGFACVDKLGSSHKDEILPSGFASNNSGGTLGGISTGQNILVSCALKPTSSITTPCKSIDVSGNPVEVAVTGRHDPCVGIRAVPIVESMAALTIIDLVLLQKTKSYPS